MLEHALAAEMHGDVPAVPRHCFDDLAHVLARHRRAKMREMKMQADAAHAGLVEPFDLGGRHIGFQQSDAAIAAARGGEQIDQHRVVAAVAGRVHEHAAFEAKKLMQAEQILLRRVGRREWPVRRVGKLAVRARTYGNASRRPSGGSLNFGLFGFGSGGAIVGVRSSGRMVIKFVLLSRLAA